MGNSGIPYFSLDVELEPKFELIEAEFGLKGFAVIVKLLQYIYGRQGYYSEWTNEVALLFSKKLGFFDGGTAVSEIVSAAIKRGMFDKDLYEKYQVLTSRGIQKRYFNAISRRKEIFVNSNILLVNVTQICKNVNIVEENVNNIKENVNISEQRKVKKSKEKKSNNEDDEAFPYQEVINLFNSTCVKLPKAIKATAPRKKLLMQAVDHLGTVTFEDYFTAVSNSEFLCSSSWCDFDWLLEPSNIIKVLEGKYSRKNATASEKQSYDPEAYEKMNVFDIN